VFRMRRRMGTACCGHKMQCFLHNLRGSHGVRGGGGGQGVKPLGVAYDDLISWRIEPTPLAGYNKSTWHYFEAPWLMRRGDHYILSYMMDFGDCPGNQRIKVWMIHSTEIGRPNTTSIRALISRRHNARSLSAAPRAHGMGM
jgi:hypothetical protein